MHKSFKEKVFLFSTASVLKHFGAEMCRPLTPGSVEIQFLLHFICYMSVKYSSLDLTSVCYIEINFKFGLPKLVR